MTQFETDIANVKSEVINMWQMVRAQLAKAKEALITYNKDLAHEVIAREKRVNALELKIDRDCENVFALFCPVAIDLRFLLAVLKINNNLERIGDIAEGIARYIVDADERFNPEVFENTGLLAMYDESISILADSEVAFESENTLLARTIFARDGEVLDPINREAEENITNYIRKHPERTHEALYVLSIIRKLERVGDQCKNIAEEIIFYFEAKVLKHQ